MKTDLREFFQLRKFALALSTNPNWVLAVNSCLSHGQLQKLINKNLGNLTGMTTK